MAIGNDSSTGPFSEMHWKSLRYFNLYRFCIAFLLFSSSVYRPSSISILSPESESLHLVVTTFYLLATTVSLVGLLYYRRRFNMQLSLNVLVDVLVLTLLMHTGGGLRSGLGVMMLVTLAGAGLVGQGRLVLLYAALATLTVLAEQSYRAIVFDFEMVDFFQAGLFSAGFFAVAITARLLAQRIITNEELARQRGIDLRNQTLVGQRVIEEMQDGVLVLDRNGWVKQHNPRAEQLLGLGDPAERKLVNYSTELARGFSDWCEHAARESVLVRAPASGMQLRARFVSTESSDRDVLIFLEDMGRLQEQARQLKLAALGRLTANIAHEIRNPLSAINHAGELLSEECTDLISKRLLRIVLDNTQRVERIVSDVLELGRRDRAYREQIDLRRTLPNLVEEFTLKEKIATGIVETEFLGLAMLFFDRSHFHQVLWNLLGNALRHSQGKPGSVCIRVSDGGEGWANLHVIDDGSGVDESFREQVFEPFFTTHSRGTGLGLYIARELCEANGARLELLNSEVGADFCLTGRVLE
ncbi:ATP-binding protein [Propionivibrio sp.]|uniref:sensor histidine kinase n=1 Tax=Propionivibrio sp. TaxID=2212460 RepID=UPI0025F0939D|nr:ATP-binding protein [Propionivibrio sp.]MBK8401971.1 PAS domain-containing protein [Propionivibrio sp.]MBK8743783.1 PAS domain-containing protein [Propionivibrio sp.]MBK8895479.1 PAS domain-containing protein [Propionivibrio sp.]MBL0206693.1 PAS domain-containing protein [Propionivibrio sp.]